MTFDLKALTAKQKMLEEAKVQLKSEFFGMDDIIDKVMDSIYAWFIFPQLITRPVIINLWGMTGVGKTQLVRRIAHLLKFFDRFVEVQMDGTSGGSGFFQSSIASVLGDSSIEEGQPGILLLDEIQRFRTIDEHGSDVKVYRFQDVWMLLSDGKFAADSTIFREVEDLLAQQEWHNDRKNSGDDDDDDDDGPEYEGDRNVPPAGSPQISKPKAPKAPRKFSFSPWEAARFKRLLKLQESIPEIMVWNINRVQSELMTMRTRMASWEIDYTKLLIFVSGNLDEAFAGSNAAEDCDTDADIYHDLTKKISSSDIKSALADRFRPEQVARLGNNHIIYPSLSKESYYALIRRTCNKYVSEMEEISGLKLTLDPAVYQEIYDNAVYPTQGTRPVFSSVHKIFSSALSNMAVWAVENRYKKIAIGLDAPNQKLIAKSTKAEFSYPVDLELRSRRKKKSIDFNTLVAVHEAGHALVYALLFKRAPLEVKINVVSFTGGYNFFDKETISIKTHLRDRIAVCLAGGAAEELVFGSNRRSTGCRRDISSATVHASSYVREHGFNGTLSLILGESGQDTKYNTDIEGTNDSIEDLCQEGFKSAQTLLTQNKVALKKLVDALLDQKKLDPITFKELLSGMVEVSLEEVETDYSLSWKKFSEE